MPDAEETFETIRTQVNAARDRDSRPAIAVRLGVSQREALEEYVRTLSGNPEAGPLVSFAGLEVRTSNKQDHIALLWAEGDDSEDTSEQVVPESPPPPVEIPPNEAAVDAPA